ncbi:MAG TPA: lipoate--protein ligase family protein [Candidatus Hydrogenedens sp.]|nr:lipoate--protein ligase family protein [Candidatus Hydrogenedens sp.]
MPIRVIIHSFSTPEENLSAEEFFFLAKDNSYENDILRIWESEDYFIVLGSSQVVSEEVFFDECISRNIKVLRRCSAGGAVLQGPGCVNFSLSLNLERYPQLRNIRESYNILLSSLYNTLNNKWQINTDIDGISDLCYKGKKVSGNAQRRNSKVLLHHGTLLYEVNYDLMEEILRIPQTQPDYRAGRSHRDFVGFLPLSQEEILDVILSTFAADGFFSSLAEEEIVGIQNLAFSKYSNRAWNFKR